MSEVIDCLFIGHNEMQFHEYEKILKRMGTKSPAYRDINLNFVRYEGMPYSAPEIFNMFNYSNNTAGGIGPLSLGDTFSAAISYLGTYLHKRGLKFDYVNSFQGEKEELEKKLKKNNILAIAITTTLYVSVFPILEIVSFIKRYNDTAKIIIGGPFVSTNLRTQDEITVEFLFDSIGADFYINSSQGEAALVNIIKALKHGHPFDAINNIHYRDGEGYAASPLFMEDNRLEENMVDWDLFADRLGRFAAVRTAISCPFSCAFCGFPQHAGKYQTASVEAIEYELGKLDAAGRVKSVNFIDDTFNVPPDRFKDILRMMIKNKYSFKWHSYFRCQYADKETIELMKESGCEGVFLGIESGNQLILHNMNKSATLDKYKMGMELLKECGIVTFASFVTGFPGETHETVQDTVAFIEETRPDFYRTQLWYCEPITPIWQKREEYKIKGSQFEWSHSTMDSSEACDLIDNMYLKVKNSIWLPQYNFDFVNIFHLLHRGFTLNEVKEFIRGFNSGIRDRLMNLSEVEISAELAERIKAASKPNSGI